MVFVVPPGSLLLTRRNAEADRPTSRERVLWDVEVSAEAEGLNEQTDESQ